MGTLANPPLTTTSKISNSDLFCGGFFNRVSGSVVDGVVPCKILYTFNIFYEVKFIKLQFLKYNYNFFSCHYSLCTWRLWINKFTSSWCTWFCSTVFPSCLLISNTFIIYFFYMMSDSFCNEIKYIFKYVIVSLFLIVR